MRGGRVGATIERSAPRPPSTMTSTADSGVAARDAAVPTALRSAPAAPARDPRAPEGGSAADGPPVPERRAPSGTGVPRERVPGLVAGAAAVVGSLGPWATIGPFTTGGPSGDGVITLVLAALALCAIGLGRLLPGVAVAGGLIAAVALYDALDVASTGGPLDPSPGWGVLLTAVAGVALAVWAVRALRAGRRGD